MLVYPLRHKGAVGSREWFWHGVYVCYCTGNLLIYHCNFIFALGVLECWFCGMLNMRG
ncbi:hypothetical protein MNBD_GAMMA26-1071 [hydrothermal vent metagenome]|uniref:Uncharacterized protein n=1 Tax=hydrothermal vent metagenome TaxID=652676 RepID=A0A3B1BR59_9ZZZZ